jgi:hypothetical protein
MVEFLLLCYLDFSLNNLRFSHNVSHNLYWVPVSHYIIDAREYEKYKQSNS